MAIQLPTNLYAGEAERINMMPHVQFQTQLMQQKAAKDEAIDQYYKKLPETINQKGVRDQEVPLINGAKNDIQEFYMKNKSAIVNPKLDNGQAQFELQKKYRDASNLISQSQNRAKTDLELGKMRFEGGKDYIFQNPDFLHRVEAHSKPIGTDGSEALDLATVAVPPKPFDPTSYVKEFSDIKSEDDTPLITPHPTDKAYKVVVTHKKLSEDAKMSVYQRAATKFHNDPSFTQNIESIAQDENNVSKLNEAFQSTFKHPIQSKEDLAAAYTLAVMPQVGATQKVIDNEEYKRSQKISDEKEMARFKNSLNKATQEDLIRLRQKVKDSGDTDTNNVWVDNYLSSVEKNAKPSSGFLNQTGIAQLLGGGNKDITPDPVLYKALNEPDRVTLTPKGQYKVDYFIYDANKKPIGIDESRSGTFTKDQIKLALGYKTTGKKQLAEEMQNTNPLDLDL